MIINFYLILDETELLLDERLQVGQVSLAPVLLVLIGALLEELESGVAGDVIV